MADRDLVGLRIRYTENVQGKLFDISFRWCEQLNPDVVLDVIYKVVKGNARFVLTDRFEVHLDHVRMPAGNGKFAEKTKGRSSYVLSAIKKIIVVKEHSCVCLTH